ncbi:MAG: hypothetical protein ACUVRQ_04425 [Thermoanaerobaculaceae bacterium]
MKRICGFSLFFLAALWAAGCGPKETHEQRINRLRRAHQVIPTAVQNRTTAQGVQLILDFTVVNTAREPLPVLTVKVIIVDPHGQDRATHLVSLDTGGLRPGVASQVTGFIPDEKLGEGESVRVEVEGQVPVSQQKAYPEFRRLP